VRGIGKDDIGEYSLQGYVKPSGLAHFEMQYEKSKNTIKTFEG
jgi:hypothetical protein